jgi:hypothetical protein
MITALVVVNVSLLIALMRSEYRIQRLEALTRRLDRGLRELRRTSIGPSTASEAGFLSGWGVIALLTVSAFIFMALSTGVVSIFGKFSADDGFDFLAYVFPGIAAICGGFGLYAKRAERWFFSGAGLFVLAGFVCYLVARMDKLPHIVRPDGVYSILFLTTGLVFWVIGGLLLLINRTKTGPLRKLKGQALFERLVCYGCLLLSLVVGVGYAWAAWATLGSPSAAHQLSPSQVQHP